MIELILPWPPSVNHYWRRVGARTLISRRGREYRQAVEDQAWECDRRLWPLIGRVWITIDLLPPDRRRRDVDNTLKALLDALGHIGVYQDDSQIESLVVNRRELGGHVRVKVGTL